MNKLLNSWNTGTTMLMESAITRTIATFGIATGIGVFFYDLSGKQTRVITALAAAIFMAVVFYGGYLHERAAGNKQLG